MNWRSIAVIACLYLVACQSKPKGQLEVSGTVKNLDALKTLYPGAVNAQGAVTLFLFEIPFGGNSQPIQLDSITLTESNNSFTLKGAAPDTGMYDIAFDRGGPLIPLVNDQPRMQVAIDFSRGDQFYTVNGSPASVQLQNFIHAYSNHGNLINAALDRVDSLKKLQAPDSLLIVATNAKNQAMDKLNEFLKQTMEEGSQGTVQAFVLGRSAQTLPPAEFQAALQKLVSRFPNDPSIQGIQTAYQQQAAEMERRRQQMEASNRIGKPAPELVMPDVNGKEVALSSFRGKYVLVDFWASWCGPCRMENPNVVAAYQQFRARNFTILGVSLDKAKAPWLEAIKADGLNWTQISDLAFWNSKAVPTFGFDGIPFNVLIDPQGIIIAEGLRGEALFTTLNAVLK